jgi:hypothetical protein
LWRAYPRSSPLRVLVTAVLVLWPLSSWAEHRIALAIGPALTQDGDLEIWRSAASHTRLHQASWDGASFGFPPFYELSYVYAPTAQSPWLFGIDFAHPKIYLDLRKRLRATGQRDGVRFDERVRAGAVVDAFSISHGLNYLTPVLLYRHSLTDRVGWHAGGGVGLVIPHVEATLEGRAYAAYQLHGPGFVALLGVELRLTPTLSAFVDYKVSYSRLSLDIPGATIRLEPLTHQVPLGLALHL